MASSGDYPLSAHAFLKYCGELAATAQDTGLVADALHSRDVIERKCLHQVQGRDGARSREWFAKELFLSIHDALCTSPMKFAGVVEALRCDRSLSLLCNDMEDAKVSLETPRIHTVVCELRGMCGWALLGLCFGLPHKTVVQLSRESEELSKIALVSTWLGMEGDASWKTLVAALCTVHRKHLAVSIAAKYGVDCAELVSPGSNNPLAMQTLLAEVECGPTIESLLREMEDTDSRLLEVEEDAQQKLKELLALQKQVDELQRGNITMQQCNSELLCEVLSAQMKISEARGGSSNAATAPGDAAHLKKLQENMQRAQGDLESLRHTSSNTRQVVSKITSQVEAISSNLHDLMQRRMELTKAMRQCERSMNSHLLEGHEQSKPQQGGLSAIELHQRFVKMELESHEHRLEVLEASKASVLKTIDSLDRDMENILASSREPPTESQLSLDALYSSALRKHGGDNCMFYIELRILQHRVQLALQEWESCVCESEMYPMIQELSNLQSNSQMTARGEEKSRSESTEDEAACDGEDDYLEFENVHDESSLDRGKRRLSSDTPAPEENQYISMEEHRMQTKSFLSPPQPSQKDSKKFLSLRRFSPTKRKTKQASKKKDKFQPPLPPFLHQKKYHTIGYRGEPKTVLIAPTPKVEEKNWYADVSRDIAEYRLKQCDKDGAFLVRPSSTSKGKFVLSLLYGGRITHARIEKALSGKYTVGDEDDADFESVVDLVEHYQSVPFVVCGSTTLQFAC